MLKKWFVPFKRNRLKHQRQEQSYIIKNPKIYKLALFDRWKLKRWEERYDYVEDFWDIDW